jgi:tRNA-specific adenosine deaminase 1
MKSCDIARLCCDFYSNLPKKGKPVIELGEWTVMSAFIVGDLSHGSCEVVALGTGTKCLGACQVAVNGTTLNDGHAEVVARRCFARYLISQVKAAKLGHDSLFEPSSENSTQFVLKETREIYFYTSQVPCGDASIMPKESVEQSELPPPKRIKLDVHRTGAKCVPEGLQDPLSPDSDYHVLGAFRTKPGRGEPTLSLSCSDKMAKWNVLGLQGSLLSRHLCSPVRWKKIIVSSNVELASASLQRALISRFAFPDSGYSVDVEVVTGVEFEHGRNAASKDPAPGSILWHKGMAKPEVSVDGYRLGATKKIRGTPKAAVVVSPRSMFALYCETFLVGSTERKVFNYDDERSSSESYHAHWARLKSGPFSSWPSKRNSLSFQVEYR